MDTKFNSQFSMPACFACSRGACFDAQNMKGFPLRHAVVACLFLIFLFASGVFGLVLAAVIGLLVLLSPSGLLDGSVRLQNFIIKRSFLEPEATV